MADTSDALHENEGGQVSCWIGYMYKNNFISLFLDFVVGPNCSPIVTNKCVMQGEREAMLKQNQTLDEFFLNIYNFLNGDM